MRHDTTPVQSNIDADFCVVGGGFAGLCAAITAARRGLKTVLVNNRSVLGGNASGEIRQHIGGASFLGEYPNSREGGVAGELWSRIRRQSYANNVNDYAESSVLFLDACRREPNLTVVLNTHITDVERDGRAITAVSGAQSSTGKRIRIGARHFADCTGDANVAFLAGAAFRSGQEPRSEFNESLAPETSQRATMGNTILFQAEKLDCPVPFEPFDWLVDLEKLDTWWTMHPPKGPLTSGSWVFEYGGRQDTIADAEEIHFELLKILYSVWWYLKRRPECGMENYRITFISSLPGKRESRRVIGDYTLTQNDIVETRRFPDDVAYAGWGLDLHNPDGFYGKERPTTFFFFPEIHSVPLRCLYARDVDNLWLAGRDISVTHVALGGLRVMASCGLCGQAIATAAATAIPRGHTCHQAVAADIRDIQQSILKDGGFIPGVRNDDPLDLARQARVSASSEACLETGKPEDYAPIGAGLGIAFPVTAGRLETLTLAVRNTTGKPVRLRGELRRIKTPRDFHPDGLPCLTHAETEVAPMANSVTLHLGTADLPTDLYMVHLFADAPELELGQTRRRLTGIHAAEHHPDGIGEGGSRQLGMPEPVRWVRRFNRARGNPDHHDTWHPTPCFTLAPRSHPYAAANVVNGVNRPERLPNLWASDPRQPLPQILELRWDKPIELCEIRIIWDDDMDLPIPWTRPVSTLVSDYEIETLCDGRNELLAAVSGNMERMTLHRFAMRRIEAVRIRVNGVHAEGEQARICEIRGYGQSMNDKQ